MDQGQIFISYRRDDSAGFTRAVYDQLAARFPKRRIFMDVDAIEPGLPFDEVIQQAVGSCALLLVMIGKRWLEPQADGRPRIADPGDFVHLEVATALARDVRVIPVLLDGAAMPGEMLLPEPLRPLARRNAIEIGNSRFEADVERLVAAVSKALGEPVQGRKATRRPLIVGAFGASAVLVAGSAAWWLLLARVPLVDESRGQVQAGWRYCRKCQSLFFDGYREKGICAAGGSHDAEGLNFVLHFGVRALRAEQADWRFCPKCNAMFFDGYASKGVCPAGGGHVSEGFNFVLRYDKSGPGQGDWRFCRKCQSIFFDGYLAKGICPAGAAHVAAGFNFVLPHA